MRNPQRALCSTALFTIVACSDGMTTPGPVSLAPEASMSTAGGERAVQFLPPMVAGTPVATTAFDPSARPEVSVVPGSSCVGTPVVGLAVGSSGREALKLDASDGTFHAVWHTKGRNLATGDQPDYRLCVHENGALLGYLDLDVVGSARERRSALPGTLALALDAPLVISFGVLGTVPAVGPPASIVFTRQPSTAGAGAVQLVAIEVHDANGAVVAGASGTVSMALAAGARASGATLGGTTSMPLAGGAATFSDLVLTLAASGYTLDATFDGMTATSVPFDVTPGPAATMTLVAGDGQVAMVGTAVTIAPEVRIADAFGNVVPGQLVRFSVGVGGGSVTGSSPTSDAFGRAAVGSWVLGPAFGVNTLLVSSGSLGPGIFSALGSFMPPP